MAQEERDLISIRRQEFIALTSVTLTFLLSLDRISPARFLFLGTMAGLATGGLQDLRDELRARTDSDLQ